MIFFVTTKRHNYTIRKCLNTCGKPLEGVVEPMCYGNLLIRRTLAHGTYVLSDLERLSSSDLNSLINFYDTVSNIPEIRVLNHPTRTLRRFDLLRLLYEKQINSFNAFRLEDDPKPGRFPVFIRGEDDHKGPLSELVESQAKLEDAILLWKSRWGGLKRKIVTEHLDVSDRDGVYRKYSAFCIGGRIIPRHLFFGSSWCVKAWELMASELLEEERRYIETNPHESKLKEIFQLAGVEFGRIDYGVHQGQIQVWEINTNPMLPVNYGGGGPRRQWIHDWFATEFESAMRAINLPTDGRVRLSRRAIPIWAAAKIPCGLVYRRITRGERKKHVA